MNQKFFCLLLLCQSVFQTTFAVTVENLYFVEIPVANQTDSLRQDAFREAFRQTIIKVSGSDDALGGPAFKKQIEDSARYVKQFTYVSREGGNTQALNNALYLKIDFDQQQIERLLRDNNFPVWGEERPGSLLVISYDVNNSIKLVSTKSTPKLVNRLNIAASKQSLPILYPLMDRKDISIIRVDDVVSRNMEKIDSMSARYKPDVLVVGQIVGRGNSNWRGDWQLHFDGQLFKWQYSAASQTALVKQLVRYLSRVLAREYALDDRSASHQNFLISISPLSGVKQLIEVTDYLQSLAVVNSARIALIKNDVVTFKIRLKNKVEDLQHLIRLGKLLKQIDAQPVNVRQENTVHLNYVYIGAEREN